MKYENIEMFGLPTEAELIAHTCEVRIERAHLLRALKLAMPNRHNLKPENRVLVAEIHAYLCAIASRPID